MPVTFETCSDGRYWCGRGIGADILTQGKTPDELMVNIREAAELHVEEEPGKGEHIRILSLSEFEARIPLPGLPVISGKDLIRVFSDGGFIS